MALDDHAAAKAYPAVPRIVLPVVIAEAGNPHRMAGRQEAEPVNRLENHMSDLVELHARQIDAATEALGRNDRPAAVIALSAAIETTRSNPALHRQHVDGLIRLARIKQELAQPAQAERLLTEALATGERHLGASHPELAVVLNELSRLFLRQSAYARAEPLLERLLEINKAKGDDHPDVATVLAARAVARRGLGDDAAAEALYRRVLAIREKVLAPNHMVVVITLEQLSETCAARGNFAEALALLRRALPTRERALGAEHASVRALCVRIADLELKVPANTPIVAAAPENPKPPENASQLVFIYEPERPKIRRVTQPRDRVTPQFSAAVAAASLIAAPAPLAPQPRPSAPTQMAAPSLVTASAHDTFADSNFSLSASTAPIDRTQQRVPRFAVDRTPAAGTTDGASTGKRIARLVPATAGALAIAVAMYAASSYAASHRDGVKAQSHAEEPVAVAVAPPPTTALATINAPEKSAVGRTDAARTASAPPALVVPTRKAQQAAPEVSAPALPAVPMALPSVAGLAVPTSTTLNVDSVMRASGKAERESYADLAPTATLRTSAYGGDRSATSPVLIGDAPQPRYPDMLRAQRIEGEVVVQFIVDETGRVDVSSMKTLRSPHELFTTAVRIVLPKFRFEPARSAASKPIAERVQYTIQFAAPK
ncbi:MAG: Tfp pilus assembly protein PilF [Gemmatimonadetes bacterium]|nr:Tfp pilus assembly protein PilF [Gemmatimonadota bacterium]